MLCLRQLPTGAAHLHDAPGGRGFWLLACFCALIFPQHELMQGNPPKRLSLRESCQRKLTERALRQNLIACKGCETCPLRHLATLDGTTQHRLMLCLRQLPTGAAHLHDAPGGRDFWGVPLLIRTTCYRGTSPGPSGHPPHCGGEGFFWGSAFSTAVPGDRAAEKVASDQREDDG